MQNNDQTNLAYLAGYFDGEGCVSFSLSRHALKAVMATADAEVLREFAKTFGGSLKPIKSHGNNKRQLYEIGWYNKKAQDVLLALLPWLRAKRDVALLALQITFGSRGIHSTPEENLLRQRVSTEIRAINQRVDAWM